MVRKFIAGTAVVVGLVVLGPGSAWAFDCYNASRSTQGNTSIAANSPAFMTFNQSGYLFFTSSPPDGLGLCPAGANWLLAQVDANLSTFGISPTAVVSAVTVQAQGLLSVSNPTAQANQSNGTGIDHIDANTALFQFLVANIPTAASYC